MDGEEVSSEEEDYLVSNGGYPSEEEDDAVEEGTEDGTDEGGEGEPSTIAARFLDPRIAPSWAPPDPAQLGKDELNARVCELERDLRKIQEEDIDAKNGRHFAIETVREVL